MVAALTFGCGGDENGDGGSGAVGGDGGSGGTAATGGDGGAGGSGGSGAVGGGGTGGSVNPCLDVDCTSENECVEDGTCDPVDGMCDPGANVPAGTECDLLDLGDGLCDGAGTCVECNDALDCGEAAQCLVATCIENACGEAPGPDSIACDLLGTEDGICDDGDCVELPPCTVADDCPDIVCSVKDCALNECTYAPTNGAACEVEPGVPGTCGGMMCVGLCAGVECTSLDDCVMDGTCDPQTGECIPGDEEPAGAPCGNGGVCDDSGTCIECNVDDDCDHEQTCEEGACTGPKIIFREDFESGLGPWSADNGVWDVGMATAGPGDCFGGSGQCAGTVLDGDYPSTYTRLISPTVTLPSVSGDDEIHLRFRNWFDLSETVRTGAGVDTGQVQVRVRDAEGTWGAWVNVGSTISRESGDWSIKDVDLTSYAGDTIRVAFYNRANHGGEPGWYIDDVEISCKAPEFTGDFESGWADWSADNGVWQVGEASAGPGACFGGSTQCAGTVLDGDYPSTYTRLVSSTIVLPSVSGDDEIHLRFRNWFDLSETVRTGAGVDTGQVQVRVRDDEGTWGAWVNVGSKISRESGGWSIKDVDLTSYAGDTIRVAFRNQANHGEKLGWYIDDVEISSKAPEFTGDFESGWADWSADNGVWQVGEASAGPGACFGGSTQCAGTVLGGDYPSTYTRLVSSTIVLPSVSGDEELRLRFRNWFDLSTKVATGAGVDTGQVQVRVRDAEGTWGAWVSVGSAVSRESGGWSVKDVDLTSYAGDTIRVAFRNQANHGAKPGWYVDDVQILTF